MENYTPSKWPICITEYNEELHLKNVEAEGRAEGLALLFSFVADGTVSLERAAESAKMDFIEFKKLYEESPLCDSKENENKEVNQRKEVE